LSGVIFIQFAGFLTRKLKLPDHMSHIVADRDPIGRYRFFVNMTEGCTQSTAYRQGINDASNPEDIVLKGRSNVGAELWRRFGEPCPSTTGKCRTGRSASRLLRWTYRYASMIRLIYPLV